MKIGTKATYEELVSLLSQGIGQRALYFESHPRVHQYAKDFTRLLRLLLSNDRKDHFFLGFAEGNLIHAGRLLVGPTILGKRVIKLLCAVRSGGILFKAAVEAREIVELFNLAHEFTHHPPEFAHLRPMLRKRGVLSIEFSPEYKDAAWFGQFLYEGTERVRAIKKHHGINDDLMSVSQDMYETVATSHDLAKSDSTLDLDKVRTVSESLANSADSFTDVMRLVRYPDYDSFTVGHSVRVAMIAVLVAHRAGLPQETLIELGTAGLLHDVGKSKVPHEILYKPGRLNQEELEIMSEHPITGAQILLENHNAGPMAIGAAFGHHLRYDGGGYPQLAKWGLSSRTTALLKACDVFEALTAVRPYKSAMEPRRAYEIMLRDAGGYDPGALTALVRAMGLYPPGSNVRLSNGERGVVLHAGEQIDRPVVRLTHDDRGMDIPPDDQPILDLGSARGQNFTVVALLDDLGSPADCRTTTDEVATTTCTHDHSTADAGKRLFGKRR